MRSIFIVFILALLGCSGCSNGPKRITAPKLDAEEITNRALTEFDKNQDSVIDAEELKDSPSLSYSMVAIDRNENGELERDELMARFETYVKRKIGLRQQQILVKKKGRPLANVNVELVPAPLMEGLIVTAKGQTGPSGYAMLKSENAPAPAAQVGFYRAKVTSDKQKIDAKFNTETTLGVEIAPNTDGLGTEMVIELK